MAEIEKNLPRGPFDSDQAQSSKPSRRPLFKFAAILAAVFVVAAGIATFVLNYQKSAQKMPPLPKPDEIVVTELPTGEKLVENKTQGYSVKVPMQWNIEKPSAGYLSINDIESNKSQNEFCKIELYSITNSNNFTPDTWINREEIKLNESFMNIIKDERKPFQLGSLSGIKRTLETAETGLSISVVITNQEKIYEVVLYPKGAEREKCINDFDSYLLSLKLD